MPGDDAPAMIPFFANNSFKQILSSGNLENGALFCKTNFMPTKPTYGELKAGTYYLIQTDAESDIELITVIMETSETVLLRSYLPATEDFFRFNAETIYKLIVELDAETAGKFESLYGGTEAANEDEEELFEYEDDEE